MPSAFALRAQIEATLEDRIPSALTPMPRIVRPVMPTGIPAVDNLLDGGFPVGAITEMVGPECSGRTSVAYCFIAQCTKATRVCAWVDVSNALDPESVAAVGVDLTRLLWVRCGVPAKTEVPQSSQAGFTLAERVFVPPAVKKGLHGGGFGPHPRSEVKGLPQAVGGLLRPQMFEPRCAEPQRIARPQRTVFNPAAFGRMPVPDRKTAVAARPWTRIEQALRVTDLLLQSGGFGAIVLDMGSIAAETVSRIPMATWFRYRAAAERTQQTILLLTQYASAKSSAGLVLRFDQACAGHTKTTVFAGMEHRVEVSRQRFSDCPTEIIPLRKPPQRETAASWRTTTSWTGSR